MPSTATGTADLTIEGDQIVYTVNVVGLTNAVVSHIHIAPVGENGPVRMDLCGTGAPLPACTSGTGVLASGQQRDDRRFSDDHLRRAGRGDARGQCLCQRAHG